MSLSTAELEELLRLALSALRVQASGPAAVPVAMTGMARALIEPVLAECRIYYAAGEWGAPHQIALNLRHRPNDPQAVVVTMHSVVMPHTRATLRALLTALVAADIKTVHAHRRGGHRLPGGKLQPDGS